MSRSSSSSTCHVLDFDEKHFEELMTRGKAVIVDCYTDDCGPCKKIAPKIEKMAAKYDKVVFFKMNCDKEEELANEWDIQSVPTFFFFKGGKKIAQVTEANPDLVKSTLKKCFY